MSFDYDYALGSSFAFTIILEGDDSSVTGFSPRSATVMCREVSKPQGVISERRFVLTSDEATDLCEKVARSEIFNLPERRLFGNESDQFVLDGCAARAELTYRSIRTTVTRLQSSHSLPFELMREYLDDLLKKKTAEPGATDNPDDAQRLREDH